MSLSKKIELKWPELSSSNQSWADAIRRMYKTWSVMVPDGLKGRRPFIFGPLKDGTFVLRVPGRWTVILVIYKLHGTMYQSFHIFNFCHFYVFNKGLGGHLV